MLEFIDSSLFVEGSIISKYLLAGVLLLVVASFVAGYIDAIAGGAGLILIPAFILTGLPPQLALGQEKLVSTIGTIAAIKNFIKNKSVIWSVVPAGLISALVGAYVGAKVILLLPAETLSLVIVVLLPIGLIAATIKGKIKNVEQSNDKHAFLPIFLVCFTVGFYDGFFGPGTGSLFIIALTVINRFQLLQASATSKIFNFSSNIGAFVAFAIAGKMAYVIGVPMIISSLIGNHIGSLHAIKTNGEIIRKVLFISVGVMMITLLVKYFPGY
ncbi:sulfite exporter TauE/SafE family protein [Dickeya lacustris]|uniref:Probable membrane transporter protein n=1 Tax=Dickeya lacustris TaxID=2259638 RepID=A0ABY8GB37_9GAMM|nr:TSUP family transporter [Dickeya lacustris]WFN57130.1 TSUP family transporter [Dickeya lacustris]